MVFAYYPGIIKRPPALNNIIPTGININVQHKAKPMAHNVNPNGRRINIHKQAFNTAPVNLNAIPNNPVNKNRHMINVIILPYPSNTMVALIKFAYCFLYVKYILHLFFNKEL